MKKQVVCEYCNKVFQESKDENSYGNDYKQECVNHEITHLNLEKKFRLNLQQALKQIDEKYASNSLIERIEISACWDSYYGKDITYDFKVNNSKIIKVIESKIEVPYAQKEMIPTSLEIINQLEHHFFIPTINKKYEGIFNFEDYMGGNGADDFMIGDSYMRTIFEAFKGKKVRIEVIK